MRRVTYVKWPRLLVWHMARIRRHAEFSLCGLLVSTNVLRRDAKPDKFVCRQCELAKETQVELPGLRSQEVSEPWRRPGS